MHPRAILATLALATLAAVPVHTVPSVSAASVGGTVAARPNPQTNPDGGPAAPPEQPARPNARAILEALAELAGIPPRQLRAEAQTAGGLTAALRAHGVTDAQMFQALLQVARDQLQPAVDQGRLSPEQADQLARQRARRIARTLLDLTPPGGARRPAQP